MKKILMFYGAIIIAHYVASHAYIYSCTPRTVIGFLMSPFVVTTPYCQAYRWMIYHGGSYINTMWISLGIWILAKIKIYE
jgi:hypothetical protein